MATTQQYSLRWNNYFRHLTYALDNHRNNADFVDVSLFCDGRKIRAHKVVLSSCSSYFKEIFKENPHPHPVIVFKFIKFEDLNSIIEFMYQGEVNVQQEALQSFLQTAELLAVQGLTAEEKEKSKPVQPAIIDEQKLIKTIPSTIRAVSDSNATAATAMQTIDAGTGHLTLNLGQSISAPAATQTATQTIETAATHLSMHVAQQQQQQQHHQQHQHQHQQQQQHQHHHVQTQQLQHMVTLPAATNTVKKRKIYTTTDDDTIYTTETVEYGVKEDATIVKTAEMTFLRSAVKVDIPEYIVSAVDDSEQLSDGNEQQMGQDDANNSGAQNVSQYTSEYEILTESEIEEKYQQADADNTEITIEMGRLLNSNAGTTTVTTAAQATAMDESVSSVTSGNNVSGGGGNSLKTDNKSSGTSEETFLCKVCKRKLQSANALRRHIASRHSEISGKVHQCSTCKKSFKTKWSLSTHNSRFHRDVRVVNECIKMNIT